MNLKQLINKSYYGTIGYISSKEDFIILEQYIIYNSPVLKEYKNIIIATNYSDSKFIEENTLLWKKHFPECIILDSKDNRGHNFGTADLDNLIFNYCKKNNIKWLCKSSNDTLLLNKILDTPINSKHDFYFVNNVGVTGYLKHGVSNFTLKNINKELIYPSTNFYFINVKKTDYLNDEKYINKTYNDILNIENYNGKIWEYIPGWSCEAFLQKCIIRNNLKSSHLLPPSYYKKVINFIVSNKISDGSMKNLFLNGICHYHFPKQPVYEI